MDQYYLYTFIIPLVFLQGLVIRTDFLEIYLEPAEDSGHSTMQGVPAPVALMDHGFKLTSPVSTVFPSQAAVLVVDYFQLRQSLVNLPLETLSNDKNTL